MPRADPFSVIATRTPQLDDDEIRRIVREHYGLEAGVEALPGERDQNVRLQCRDGRQYVLKVANAAEDPQATDFQIQALLHLESYLALHDCPVNVPRISRTRDGRASLPVTSGGERHIARVITWLAGIPLGATCPSPALCRRLGSYLAHLGRALGGFDHPGSSHALLWDMRQALSVREILAHVADRDLRQDVAETLDDFEAHALPRFGDIRTQVIHGDLNPDNVLVDADDRSSVAGVIDFGDMSKAPLVADVAIGASYLRVTEGNPLAKIADFLAAYHSVTPLELAEIDMLFDLIKTRLAVSIAILSWRATLRDADDPYLAGAVASESSAGVFLEKLRELPRDSARRIFRQVCASVNVDSGAEEPPGP